MFNGTITTSSGSLLALRNRYGGLPSQDALRLALQDGVITLEQYEEFLTSIEEQL